MLSALPLYLQWVLLQAGEVAAPTSQVSDFGGIFDGGGFDEETFDQCAAFETQCAY